MMRIQLKKRILIVTDAWNQVNGVVRTLETTIKHLEKQGFEVSIIHPGMFTSVTFPFYKEIKLTLPFQNHHLDQLVHYYKPDYIHIPVEGPLGIMMRNYCIRHGLKFTTAYHTHFPMYLKKQYHIPESWTYKFISWFHKPSSKIMVTTDYLMNELPKHGINNVGKWTRGVDTFTFSPFSQKEDIKKYALYVGRVSVEKNIEQFLSADIKDLEKVVVGDGPSLKRLMKKFPKAHFVGKKRGPELAKYYANAEVFVFPSKTDTFGLVLIEALACGTPVAAADVPHNYEIIIEEVGCISNDLSFAVEVARKKERSACRNYALECFTWEKATQQFIDNLVSCY